MLAISRSRLRRPASRVYSRISFMSASSPKATCSAVEAVVVELLRDDVAARDVELLLLGVAGEPDHLHAVAQRRRHGVEDVRGGDEQHLREVEGQVDVVVLEGVVLLGVEHLEQRRRRVAAEVGPDLVDLVEDEHRVLALGAAQALDDLARQRADVGAPVAADLGLVAHAAEAQAVELAAERRGDGLAEAGLADARRADEAQDRALDVGLHLAHRQVLEDAVLDLLEVVVVVVEDLLGLDRGRSRPRCACSRAAPPASRGRCG